MKKRPLGTTGFEIAPVVFGGNVLGWTADEAESFRVLDAFVDHGFDAIDTADVYSAWIEGNSGGESETMLGKWLAARPGMRERVTIFTKVGSDMGGPDRRGLSKRWIAEAIDASLDRLGIGEVDVYFSHRPDPETDQAETLSAYDRLIREGKVRSIGASNFDADLLGTAFDIAEREGLPAYQVIQPEYNLYDRDEFEGPLRDLSLQRDLGVVTYFSLASGFLSGKYRSKDDLKGRKRGNFVEKYLDARGLRLLDALGEVAAEKGVEPAEVALAWILHRDGVTAPIASATSVAQVESFATAATLALSEEDMARLTGAGD
ncbi:aldo/keto reductase [Celeribacter indicus]|uniref:Aldo/keto reductase n=1 Tax=Celeribacter indicus TaxID=1208324 RepID=A0A0B5E647_9RHOB|nr:aldo/keto reductase [Celeribacter indicus]AJE47807.1 aldo/keto reductase [Celeribacter indicus]SDW23566.1 Predicted oxidoreductase [Celeribacter indicus]